ncbi:MAG TPA: alkaline phosphatase family protein, partial [Myxococcales bacterium]|nr:alkaline phosphatase family protein [Myxococcales bacterium]
MSEPKVEVPGGKFAPKDEAEWLAQEREHVGAVMQQKIEHVVVLMLENRGFDHFMGWLYDPKKEDLDKTINFVGNPDTLDPWTGQKLRRFEGLAGLDEKQLENPFWFRDHGGKLHSGKFAPVKGARASNVPSVNSHEDFIHIMEDMYYGNDDLGGFEPDNPRAKLGLHEKMKSKAFRDKALKRNGAYIRPQMKGWVQNYADGFQHHAGGDTFDDDLHLSQIMDMYTPEQLPVLSWLARHYAVSDLWFCSVPSQTNTNRAFYLAGTSAGLVTNNFYDAFRKSWKPNVHLGRKIMSGSHCDALFPYESAKSWKRNEPVRSMLDVLPKTDWRYYWSQYWPPYGTGGGQYARKMFPRFEDSEYFANFPKMKQFWQDVRAGTLAPVSIIEPTWGGGPKWDSAFRMIGNEFHPSADTLCGEFFVKKLYDALSQSKLWSKTLLVITFDENGGTYDHFSPWPIGIKPGERDRAPDEHVHEDLDRDTRTQFGFEFDMYGVRVPTLLISPYIRKNTLFRSSTGVPFDHTSIIATILKWRRVPRDKWQLGERVLRAPTFDGVLQGVDDKDGGANGMRPVDHPVLGIQPPGRPGKNPDAALRYGDAVHLRYVGNKWRAPYDGDAYLGGPVVWGITAKTGWWYPVFRKRDQALSFQIASADKTTTIGAQVPNGAPIQLKVADGDAAGYRLAVPEHVPKRTVGSKSVYLTSDESGGTFWRVWLVGDRVSGRAIHPGDEVVLFSEIYWWEPDGEPPVNTGKTGYDPYQRLAVSEMYQEDVFAGFRAGEWDVWVVERAGPASAKADEPQASGKSPAAPKEPRKEGEIQTILDLADQWEQAAIESERLRAELNERWEALAKKKQHDLDQMIPKEEGARGLRLPQIMERAYLGMPPPGKPEEKLRIDDEKRRNDTPPDGNCFFHAVCGSLRALRANGTIDAAAFDLDDKKALPCRAEAVRALEEFRKTSPTVVADWPAYIKGISHEARGPGDREAWGGTVEMQALAYFGKLATRGGKPVRFVFREWSRLHLAPGYVDIGDAAVADAMIELINDNNGHWEWLTPKGGAQKAPAEQRVHMRLLAGQEPLASHKYKLEAGGKVVEGTTTADGFVDAVVPAEAKGGKLTLLGGDEPFEVEL